MKITSSKRRQFQLILLGYVSRITGNVFTYVGPIQKEFTLIYILDQSLVIVVTLLVCMFIHNILDMFEKLSAT